MDEKEKQIADYCIQEGYIIPEELEKITQKQQRLAEKGTPKSFIVLLAQHCGWSKEEAKRILRNASLKEKEEITVASTIEIPSLVSKKNSSLQDEKTSNEFSSKSYAHFKVLSKLGEGTMGVVYLAKDPTLDRNVALKVLSSKLCDDKNMVKRFIIEAQAIAKISHPNIVQIYFIGEKEGEHFMAMEYIEGKSLENILDREKHLTPERSLNYIRQAASGLEAAFEKNVIHRDIKPANLLINYNDVLKITDFGIAKLGETDLKLTTPGMIIGSPLFMSPEQGRGDEVDFRTDIYSLGVTFFYILTGQPPFKGQSAASIIYQHATQSIPCPKLPTGAVLPMAFQKLIMKMMAKNINERYSSYENLIRDIDQLLENMSETPSKRLKKTTQKQPLQKRVEVVEKVEFKEEPKDSDIEEEKIPIPLEIQKDATPLDRLKAFAIDFLPAFLIFYIFFNLFNSLSTAFIILGIQHALMIPLSGQTIGKQFIGIKVVDKDDALPTLYLVICRVFIIMISVGPLVGLPFIVMLFSPKHEPLHDIIFKTKEIKMTRPLPLNINLDKTASEGVNEDDK